MNLYQHEYSKTHNAHLLFPAKEARRFLASLFLLGVGRTRSWSKIIGFGKK